MDMRNIFLAAVVALCATCIAGTAWADNCGTSDRVPLPDCTQANVTSREYSVVSNCSYTITVKADIKNAGDHRFNLAWGESRSHRLNDFNYTFRGRRVRGLHCCPRYNRCD